MDSRARRRSFCIKVLICEPIVNVRSVSRSATPSHLKMALCNSEFESSQDLEDVGKPMHTGLLGSQKVLELHPSWSLSNSARTAAISYLDGILRGHASRNGIKRFEFRRKSTAWGCNKKRLANSRGWGGGRWKSVACKLLTCPGPPGIGPGRNQIVPRGPAST